jgi:hypothetical protein
MPCFHPQKVWKTDDGIKFYNPYFDNRNHEGFKIACRQCTGCRLEQSRQWAMRIFHEQSLWPNNIFITLTYDNEHLPKIGKKKGNLVKKDFQDFMKRLREPNKELNWYPPKPIRYFHCGEYGEKNDRPHYHAVLFNCSFNDYKPLKGFKGLSTSETLNNIWGKGYSSIGNVTFDSASYVAGYVQKKINGKQKESHYAIIDSKTGEYFGQRQQEYSTMSRRPGIAGLWFAKHKSDVFPSDNIHINGREMRPPKYYDRLYEIDNQEIMDEIKKNRQEHFKENAHLYTPEALAQAKLNHNARMSIFKRGKL